MPMPDFTDGQVLFAAQLNPIADEVDRLGTAKSDTTHGHALTDANITGIIPVAQMPTIAVTKGGTGRTTSTTAYGLIAAGTTATGNQQTVAPGTAGHALVSAGAAALPAFRQLTYADVTGTVPTAALPPLAINETFVVASQAAMLALTAQRGDMAIRTDNARTYVLATDAPTVLADWKEISAAGQVTSVASKTGAVSLVKADVGLGSVDNTADSAKPVSTAQAAAIALKANIASPTFTGTVAGITAAMVGLGSVNNTADSAKPVSTAQQTALNLKANLASPTFTGSVTVPTPTATGHAATKGYVDTAVTGATVQVILVEAANWPPAADPNPNKWYVKVS